MFAWVSFSENVRNRGKAIFEDFDVVTYALNVLKDIDFSRLSTFHSKRIRSYSPLQLTLSLMSICCE